MGVENVEGLISGVNLCELNIRDVDAYVQELKVSEQDWILMNKEDRADYLKAVVDRVSETGLSERYSSISDCLKDVYGENIRDAYEAIEAPHDHIQIDRISDAIESMENLRFDKWVQLSLENRLNILNELSIDLKSSIIS